VSLNWKEINLILEELRLEGGQIQKVYQSAYDALALQVYGGNDSGGAGAPLRQRLILISLSPLACRLHETFRPVPKSEKPLRFAELLKSRILNSRITSAVQLGDNRIVWLGLRRGENLYRLYIRLWSNAANVILTGEDGTILDAMRRLPRRGEVTGGFYRPEDAPAGNTGPAAPGGDRDVKVYEVRELPGEGSFNRRVDDWYAERGGRLSLDQLREEGRRIMGRNKNRLGAALERLREKEADYAGAGRYRECGDLILTLAPPEGSSWLDAAVCAAAPSKGAAEPAGRASALETSAAQDGQTLRIELDPGKNFSGNAEAYYEKYRKAKNGLGEVREEIAAGERELERLNETEARLLAETNPLILERLLKKVRRGLPPETGESPPGKGKKPGGGSPAGRPVPGLSFQNGDWLILVGRDARENDELLRRHVKGGDLWLHVRDWAGSYVFIKQRPGKSVPLEILLDAGNLALFYSKGRNNGKGDLYYTQVKYLRRAKNGPPGLVIPTQEKNVTITLDQARLKRLESARR
jgi:predicted ribosome quality control (RQC) complex YloA/Tae2 family protein